MATATLSRKSTRNVVSASVAPVPDPVAPVNVSAGIAPVNGPTMQETLASPAPVSASPAPESIPTGELTAQFVALADELRSLIVRQSAALVGFYVERGRVAIRAINVKVGRATNKASRAKAYTNAIDALSLVALAACDEAAESKPNVARWIALAGLAELFPRAAELPSVSGAVAMAVAISRVDPPATWDAPVTFYVKPRYRADLIADLIERAISGGFSAEEIANELEIIGGRVIDAPESDKSADPFDSARNSARSTVEKGMNGDIDLPTFFDEFVSIAAQFDYVVAPARTGNGTGTVKLSKSGR